MLVIHPSSCCDICLDPYSVPDLATSPHAIACGHVFCLTCLYSLATSACPLCREPFELDHVKKLHLRSEPERDNAERGVVSDHASLLLHRMSLVSGEDTPEIDVVEVVSEVQEWLQSQPDDPNSVSPFHRAGASQTRRHLLPTPHLIILKFLTCGIFSIYHFELR
ncbi:hypothetical protein DEU56DRAFT_347705 [Suillus clintonianus]|uniref:uncharacterized protein n=1 Tax=Suillus clintonianus TaxID=1904413 RepID=UPI001B880C9D|nr:uncharacterized protein DEU56DRAFT_347705 [Suillus clintonianus]KAG2137461.1 hypothetical protein DEU56DRAFT_347705 [Suillus clintonianus]